MYSPHQERGGFTTSKSICAYKLDLSKAYEKVDWSFLKQAMEKLDFSLRFMEWVMT
jgi:hypothetical protein